MPSAKLILIKNWFVAACKQCQVEEGFTLFILFYIWKHDMHISFMCWSTAGKLCCTQLFFCEMFALPMSSLIVFILILGRYHSVFSGTLLGESWRKKTTITNIVLAGFPTGSFVGLFLFFLVLLIQRDTLKVEAYFRSAHSLSNDF